MACAEITCEAIGEKVARVVFCKVSTKRGERDLEAGGLLPGSVGERGLAGKTQPMPIRAQACFDVDRILQVGTARVP